MSTTAEDEVPNSLASTYDMDFGESDNESSASTTKTNDTSSRDHWFGKKYFECVIAQSVLLQSFPGQDVADVEDMFEYVVRNFPHQEALNRCDGLGATQSVFKLQQIGDELSRKLLTIVGATVRTGSHQERTFLIKMIRDISQRLQTVASQDQEPSSPRLAMADPVIVKDMGQYATALKEYGDQHGFTTSWAYQSLSVSPPKHVAKLACGSRRFEGVGRNKKLARHQAAYAACSHFGISI